VSHFLTKFWSQSVVQTVAIGTAGAAWITLVASQKQQLQTLLWAEQSSLSKGLDALRSRLRVQQVNQIQWVAAPSLLKHWLQQAPEQVQSLGELHTVTTQRAQQLFGSSSLAGATIAGGTIAGATSPGSNWRVAAEWHVSQAFLSTAMPDDWFTALAGIGDQQSRREAVVTPNITSPLQLILTGFKEELPANGWLAIAVANTLYVMYLKGKICLHFRSLQLHTGVSEEDIQATALVEWQRDMLRTQHSSNQLHCLSMMPTRVPVTSNSVLLKPISWPIQKVSGLLDMQGNDVFLNAIDSSADLSEVKQAAWCALQCSESLR
jgi:hypothetical protein